MKLGIGDRVHFFERYMSDSEIDTFFRAADVVLLAYQAGFVSQSGILHLAANWDKPVLASSGPGPLIDTVQRYRLGVTVKPDFVEELVEGLERVFATDHSPVGWQDFRRDASWKVNIDRLLNCLAAQEAQQRAQVRSI